MNHIYIHHVFESVALHEVQRAFSGFSEHYYSKLIKYTNILHDMESIDEQDFNHFINDINRWNGIKISTYGNPPKNWKVISSFENKY